MTCYESSVEKVGLSFHCFFS